MATITVETGSGSASANSYVSEADLTTYASDRGITLTTDTDVLIIKAMDYIESLHFKGTKNTDAQALMWPRYGVFIDSYYVDNDSIPSLLIDALCEVCIGIDGGNDPLEPETRATKREKVGEIEVEYMDGARNMTYLRAANAKLKKLTFGGMGYAIRG